MDTKIPHVILLNLITLAITALINATGAQAQDADFYYVGDTRVELAASVVYKAFALRPGISARTRRARKPPRNWPATFDPPCSSHMPALIFSALMV